MTLLWTKSKLPMGSLITWGLEVTVSHFAICFFDAIVLQSNFKGVHVMHLRDFLKQSKVIYRKKVDLSFEVEASLLAKIMQEYYGKKYDWKWFFSLCYYAVRLKVLGKNLPREIKWRSRDRFLCTEVVQFLEPVLGKIDVGNGSPYVLAEKLGVFNGNLSNS